MDPIDRIRRFNRFYTGRLGLLGRTYLDSGLGLSDARLLYDIDGAGPITARDLTRGSGLDEAQVSRSLAKFERKGWIVRETDPEDARRRVVRLTRAGLGLVGDLRLRARKSVERLMSASGPGAAERLAILLEEAEALLSGETANATLRDLRPGDAGWIVSRHGALYAQDEGYDESFEALVAEIVAAFLRGRDPSRERGWIADRAGRPVGSIFCVAEGAEAPGVARLRLFLVEKSERGSGLAQHMLETCMKFARDAGYDRMRLWTHESHRAAGRLYARNGFLLVDSRPARAFGQDTVDQVWERAL